MKLNELKARAEKRKILNAPLEKLLGPTQSERDFDELLELAETMRSLLRECHVFVTNSFSRNHQAANALLDRIGGIAE